MAFNLKHCRKVRSGKPDITSRTAKLPNRHNDKNVFSYWGHYFRGSRFLWGRQSHWLRVIIDGCDARGCMISLSQGIQRIIVRAYTLCTYYRHLFDPSGAGDKSRLFDPSSTPARASKWVHVDSLIERGIVLSVRCFCDRETRFYNSYGCTGH